MWLSLSEIDALARKAMRGAGASWGLAEEAGKAVKWLADRGEHEGAEALCRLLEEWPGETLSGCLEEGLSSPSGRLCPICAGSALQDHASFLSAKTVQLYGIIEPVLLKPFAEFSGFLIEHDNLQNVVVLTRGEVDVSVSRVGRCWLSLSVLHRLERWASMTYVPSSRLSRSGAGSGDSDND